MANRIMHRICTMANSRVRRMMALVSNYTPIPRKGVEFMIHLLRLQWAAKVLTLARRAVRFCSMGHGWPTHGPVPCASGHMGVDRGLDDPALIDGTMQFRASLGE